MHKYVYWPVDDFQVFPAAALEPIDLNGSKEYLVLCKIDRGTSRS